MSGKINALATGFPEYGKYKHKDTGYRHKLHRNSRKCHHISHRIFDQRPGRPLGFSLGAFLYIKCHTGTAIADPGGQRTEKCNFFPAWQAAHPPPCDPAV